MKGIDGGEVLGGERIEVCPRLRKCSEYPVAETTQSVVRFDVLADGGGLRVTDKGSMDQKVN